MGISELVLSWRGDVPQQPDKGSDERLLDLFWNRAELKKQFSGLRRERDDMIERLHEQQAETESVREEMRALEKRMANPEAGYAAIVYFQLRDLWAICHQQLIEFSEQHGTQQQERERRKQIMEFNQERQRRLQQVNNHIVSVKKEADDVKTVLDGLEGRYELLTGFWNYFKRRRLMETINEHREQLSQVRTRVEELFDRRIKIESEPWPDYPGLGLSGKRAINLAVIALSQHLYIHFTQHSLGTLSRTAMLKKLQDVHYGNRGDCEFLMDKIRIRVEEMKNDKTHADQLKARVEYLRKQAEYRKDEDTIPAAASMNSIPLSLPGYDPSRSVAGVPIDVNILADDYWELLKVLLR